MKKKSITRRILIVVLLLVLIPLVAFAAFSIYSIEKDPPPIMEVTEKVPDPSLGLDTAQPPAVGLVFSDAYTINLMGLEKLHPFDIEKYKKIHRRLIKDNVIVAQDVFNPPEIETDQLLLVHDKAYLEKLKVKSNVITYLEAPPLSVLPSSWIDGSVLAPFRRASGGTLLAARLSLTCGIAINFGGGYHHAKPDRGEGFCLYADIPIAIRQLQKAGKIERALVIDVDAHQGNGTVQCLADDETTFTFSIHEGGIYPIPKEAGDLDIELSAGDGDDSMMEALAAEVPNLFDIASPDIVFIVGGCDPLNDDPLANLTMTVDGIVQRDQYLIDLCVEKDVPVVLTLAGGYSKNAWQSQFQSIRNIVKRYQVYSRADHEESFVELPVSNSPDSSAEKNVPDNPSD